MVPVFSNGMRETVRAGIHRGFKIDDSITLGSIHLAFTLSAINLKERCFLVHGTFLCQNCGSRCISIYAVAHLHALYVISACQ